jgi:3-oxoacyl-[acyl-carrier-protein] synthase-3
MKYDKVCIEALSYTLPDESVTSAQLEQRLEPLYRRLELPGGVLEGMSGIRRRRFWPPGTRPSEISVRSAREALLAAGIDKDDIGALVHGSICRDFVEPATACLVHRGLCLPKKCTLYDVSNACLGLLNGVTQVANMIELGQIRAGLVVGTESSREVVDNTIELLNADTALTRARINNVFASLTFGSASAAVLLVNRRLSKTQNHLAAATTAAFSEGACRTHTDLDASITGTAPRLLETDSARLLEEGIAATADNLEAFLDEIGWSRADINRSVCHQVGARANRLLADALGLGPASDFTTFQELGNTGAVAIPLTLAQAAERGLLQKGHRVALVGTGAGINSTILGINWQYPVARSTRETGCSTAAIDDRNASLVRVRTC